VVKIVLYKTIYSVPHIAKKEMIENWWLKMEHYPASIQSVITENDEGALGG